MRYAVLNTVLQDCFNEDFFDPDAPENAPIIAELEDIAEGVEAIIDKKCNRTFGAAPLSETRVISDYRNDDSMTSYNIPWLMPLEAWTVSAAYQPFDGVYVLPWGVRNVTSVTVNGDWNGISWDNEEALDPAEYRLIYRETINTGWYHGIIVGGTTGATVVRVTGDWEDGAESAGVPPEIREAATFIVADMYRTRHLSPAGEIGPDGLATYVRDVWSEPFVISAIKENTFRQLVV